MCALTHIVPLAKIASIMYIMWNSVCGSLNVAYLIHPGNTYQHWVFCQLLYLVNFRCIIYRL